MTVKVTDLMVNMREILYWYLDNKKNTKKSFETSFECSLKPLKHIYECCPWNGHIHHLHTRFKIYNNKTNITYMYIFIYIKLSHIFNRTINISLNLFHICFIQYVSIRIKQPSSCRKNCVRVKGIFYAPNSTLFRSTMKECRHLLMTDDAIFRSSYICRNLTFWMQNN